MKQRANGEGTIYQRKDGRWVACITIEYGKRKSLYFKTQKEAIQALKDLPHWKGQDPSFIGKDPTIEFFLKLWLEDIAQPRIRERTYLRYQGLVEQHIIPMIGTIKLQKLMPQQLQQLYNEKRREGYAPQTIKHIHRVLHRAFHDALRWNLIERNVCDAVDAPRVPKYEAQVLNHVEACTFLQAAQGDPYEAIYVLALTTGMRQGELLGLQWKDLSLNGDRLQIRRTIGRIGKQGFIIGEPKSAKSRRNIYLTEMAIKALKKHRERQQEQQRLAGPAWDDQGHRWIFCNQIGRPIEVGNIIRRSFKPLLKKAGVPEIRFHDLRHSTATLLLSMNIHPKIVQEMLGHSSIHHTMDTYSHVLPSLQKEAVTQLNSLFSTQMPT
ncbi:site-specific integrase [Dictyobacter vulcani]|uniref:Site-specific integrase n=1 Tax=Dictyobacter vulcani TaxID=2607529 RepID=A0A5J4KJC3_9CHLR|nr:tyrosine-type recombinase/integrase [Dictyobacter vulcani]GER86527.1 site-specific integrase [Dictyobacter vulcani]